MTVIADIGVILAFVVVVIVIKKKALAKNNLGKKKFELAYRLWSIIKGSQGKNLKKKPWKNATYRLTPRFMFSYLC